DAVAADEGAVAAAAVDEHEARALAADLGVVAAGVAVVVGVEDDVVAGGAAEAHHVLVERLHDAGMVAEGVDDAQGHGEGTSLSRSMRMPTRNGDAFTTTLFWPSTCTSSSSSRCAAWMAITCPYWLKMGLPLLPPRVTASCWISTASSWFSGARSPSA